MKSMIKREISKLVEFENYWGSKENVKNETMIYNCFIDNKIVNQNWFDEKYNYTNIELLEQLLKLTK